MGSWVLVTALGLAAPDSKELPLKADEVVGEWVIQTMTKGGESVPFPQDAADRVIVRFAADGGVTWPDEHGKDRGAGTQSYTLDTSAKPARIDWTRIPAPKGGPRQTALGILTIEGDRMTLAIADDGAGRPTEFTSSKLNGTRVWVLKRVAKGKD